VFDHFAIGAQLSAMPEVGTRIIIYNLRKEEEKENASDSDDSDDEEEAQRRKIIKAKQQQLADAKKQAAAAAAAAAAGTSGAPGGASFRSDDESYELKWCGLEGDLQIVVDPASNMRERHNQMSTDVPCDYSLRAYLSMLFRDAPMQLYIQGQPVPHLDWEGFLAQTKSYPCPLPKFSHCTLLLGFSELERERGNAGLMLYWHATLIETYRRVGIQCGAADAGLGVIGVIDVGDGLEPTNNKQSFPQSNKHFKKLLKW